MRRTRLNVIGFETATVPDHAGPIVGEVEKVVAAPVNAMLTLVSHGLPSMRSYLLR